MELRELLEAKLRDAALNNRLRITGTQGGLGVSLASAASPGVSSFPALGETTRTSGNFLGGLTSILNSAGNVGQGIGAIWGGG